MKTLKNWIKGYKDWRAKQRLNEVIREQKQLHAEWEDYYNQLRATCKNYSLGKIAEIMYADLDELSKNRDAAEIRDMIFWIRFRFNNGIEETVQYYQKKNLKQNPEQRRILEYSGNPSILEYGTIGSPVMGYFEDGKLIALDNLAQKFPSTPQPAI